MTHPTNRRLLSLTFAAALYTGVCEAQQALAPEVADVGNGWYRQHFKGAGITYLVDATARRCFAAERRGGGITEIPCKQLKRRSEWIPVITWTKAPVNRRRN